MTNNIRLLFAVFLSVMILTVSGCSGDGLGNGATELCNDDTDNDEDGLIDCDDGDCSGAVHCGEDVFVMGEPGLMITPFTEGQDYEDVDETNLTIDLGDVAYSAEKSAIFVLENPTTVVLSIESLAYAADQTFGEYWGAIGWRMDEEDLIPKLPPLRIPGGGRRLIEIPFSPSGEGPAQAVVNIFSDAGGGSEDRVTVIANGYFAP